MTSPVPRPSLDRNALERVLARAAELQAQGTSDGTGALSDDQILDLGKEVGLSPDALRQAMAEERGRVSLPEATGIAGAWFGSSTISAARVVPGTPASVLAALDDVMRGDLTFDVGRRFPDRLQWLPRRGFLDVMRNQLSRPGEGGDVRLAEEVSASVVAVDAQRTHVRLDAVLSGARRRAATSSVMTVAGASGAMWIGVTTGFAATIFVPVVAMVGAFSVSTQRAAFRSRLVRIGSALEQLLDRLEFGPTKRRDSIVDKLLGG